MKRMTLGGYLIAEDSQVNKEQIKHAIILEARDERYLGEVGESYLNWPYLNKPRRIVSKTIPTESIEPIFSMAGVNDGQPDWGG